MKTSWRCLEDVFKTSWRSLKDVLKTFSKHLEEVLKMSWRRLENVLKTYTKTNMLVLMKASWRRLEDFFWRRMSKANIFVLIKTSWRRLLKTKTKDVFKMSSRRLHQDECLLGWVKNICHMSNQCMPSKEKLMTVYKKMVSQNIAERPLNRICIFNNFQSFIK